MTDKMREEFEVWAASYFEGLTKEEIVNARDEDDGGSIYIFDQTEKSLFMTGLWESWKASRAAVEIELPEAFTHDDRGGACEGKEMTHHQTIMNIATDTALTVLNGWYMLWFRYRNSKDATVRRLALRAKCKGIVGHDRVLIAAQKRVER